MSSPNIKPSHRAIKVYYETLERLHAQNAYHEGAVRMAFQNLLKDTAKTVGWDVVAELSDKIGGKTVRPDGTLKDKYSIPRGYWEAKDTDDDLDVEIGKKIRAKYPLTNIIFEDTRQAVLFQNGREYLRKNLAEPKEVAELLNAFYSYVEPNYETFDKAVEKFKESVPELANGLNKIIKEAHKNHPPFQVAFDNFFQLCKQSLNPNISRDAADEMLIQHLLTERLIRKIFNNPDFTNRNVIAVEVERVISALTSHAFSRDEYLQSLDPFYIAIENAASDIVDFKDKLHFLNTIYERFFQGYSVKIADTHGIVYTPQPIVDFMCASVAEVLKREFGKDLTDKEVHIIDPATGTGSFIVNLLHRMDKKNLPRMYRQQLFANEVMLLPYYIASLSIEHVYWEITGQYEPFDGLCFVDTLDLVSGAHGGPTADLFISEANTQRILKEKDAPITVIVGNPPYNVGQQNENDNNKNRDYEVMNKRVKETYSKDSTATNKNALSDVYVKFFRWAMDRLNGRDGIICFVSNNSFIEDIAFDGMRKQLGDEFNTIYLLDLKGNVRKDSMRDGIPIGEKNTVFGLSAMVGISITLLIRKSRSGKKILHYAVDWKSTRLEKFTEISEAENISGIVWNEIQPDKRNNWIVPKNADKFSSFVPIGTKKAKRSKSVISKTIFRIYGRGVATCRDRIAYDFNKERLITKVKDQIEAYNSEVDRYKRATAEEKKRIDDFVEYDKIVWSESLKRNLERHRYTLYDETQLRKSLYRPYNTRYLYFDSMLNERRYQFPSTLPTTDSEEENMIICLSGIGSSKPFHSLVTSTIPSLDLLEKTQCFPFYFYDEDGTFRRENITNWALREFQKQYKDEEISKWDIFYYVYGLLHHPQYRDDFADCLKRELPRIPYASDFRSFSKAGKELAEWHLNYEEIEPYVLEYIYSEDQPLSYRIEDKMRLSKDKTSLTVNPSLTLAGIPSEAFDYRLGNRSALHWVIDQYQVKRNKQGEIISDPNRKEDEQYIVRLIGQVIRVSLETNRIVSALPDKIW